mmetsp:Transcript_63915/g.76844  ORF Transcript_63915/g.76844 Transcript_63915/m.76844 type:complete len:202 (-) Transcript_63915:151-756(-)
MREQLRRRTTNRLLTGNSPMILTPIRTGHRRPAANKKLQQIILLQIAPIPDRKILPIVITPKNRHHHRIRGTPGTPAHLPPKVQQHQPHETRLDPVEEADEEVHVVDLKRKRRNHHHHHSSRHLLLLPPHNRSRHLMKQVIASPPATNRKRQQHAKHLPNVIQILNANVLRTQPLLRRPIREQQPAHDQIRHSCLHPGQLD